MRRGGPRPPGRRPGARPRPPTRRSPLHRVGTLPGVTESVPRAVTVRLPAGAFRTLEWPGAADATVVFLHGLSGVADVWGATIDALGPDRPRAIALDQRGHGHSPRTPGAYAAVDYLGDLVALLDGIAGPVHLVGHSMGARVAILAAARHPARFASVKIVDIGPEAWARNIATTARLFASLPQRFADREEALALGRAANRGEAWAERFVDWRLRPTGDGDGGYRWLASSEALVESVTVQRSRNYWRDWERIAIPALLVRGGTSTEVRPHIAEAMRRRNPAVRFVEIDDVGHNIPLDAPEPLADALTGFWVTVAVADAT